MGYKMSKLRSTDIDMAERRLKKLFPLLQRPDVSYEDKSIIMEEIRIHQKNVRRMKNKHVVNIACTVLAVSSIAAATYAFNKQNHTDTNISTQYQQQISQQVQQASINDLKWNNDTVTDINEVRSDEHKKRVDYYINNYKGQVDVLTTFNIGGVDYVNAGKAIPIETKSISEVENYFKTKYGDNIKVQKSKLGFDYTVITFNDRSITLNSKGEYVTDISKVKIEGVEYKSYFNIRGKLIVLDIFNQPMDLLITKPTETTKTGSVHLVIRKYGNKEYWLQDKEGRLKELVGVEGESSNNLQIYFKNDKVSEKELNNIGFFFYKSVKGNSGNLHIYKDIFDDYIVVDDKCSEVKYSTYAIELKNSKRHINSEVLKRYVNPNTKVFEKVKKQNLLNDMRVGIVETDELYKSIIFGKVKI